jgi:hypothetical protein
VGLSGLGCGGEDKKADSPADVQIDDAPPEQPSGIEMSSEIGGLNQEAVDRAFEKSQKEILKCLHRGAARLEFLGGDVHFFVKIDESGQLKKALPEQSTLGDRETERCMLGALSGKAWPKPVGGKTGLARKSFSFDMPNDVRPPTVWDTDSIQETLDELSKDIGECTPSQGSYTVTMYVDTDGTVMAAGVAYAEDNGDSEADCLVETLKSATFPSPGSWPAKVSFGL